MLRQSCGRRHGHQPLNASTVACAVERRTGAAPPASYILYPTRLRTAFSLLLATSGRLSGSRSVACAKTTKLESMLKQSCRAVTRSGVMTSRLSRRLTALNDRYRAFAFLAPLLPPSRRPLRARVDCCDARAASRDGGRRRYNRRHEVHSLNTQSLFKSPCGQHGKSARGQRTAAAELRCANCDSPSRLARRRSANWLLRRTSFWPRQTDIQCS